MTPLPRDYGPMLRARGRAERDARGWPHLPLRYVAYVAIALLVLIVVAVGVYPTVALADEHGAPRGYKTYCIQDPINCQHVERAEIQWSGILEGDLLLVSSWASRMAHVTEPEGEDVYRMGNCTHGDCEDKALCMIEWLVGMGYQRGALRLVKGVDEYGDPHMWVSAYTTQGVFYFDAKQVAAESRWRGTAKSIQGYDYYPPLGYAWNVLPTTATLHPRERVE